MAELCCSTSCLETNLPHIALPVNSAQRDLLCTQIIHRIQKQPAKTYYMIIKDTYLINGATK